jgi:hypothetical protein
MANRSMCTFKATARENAMAEATAPKTIRFWVAELSEVMLTISGPACVMSSRLHHPAT